MISLTKAKRILGKEVKGMTDEEIQSLLNQLYALAEVVASIGDKAGSKK